MPTILPGPALNLSNCKWTIFWLLLENVSARDRS